MAQTNFEHLFSPFQMGKVQMKNRMAKTAAQTYLFDSGDRRFGPLAKAFYGNVAKGGVGLIIVETPAMEWPLADEGDRRLRVDNDKYKKDIEELAQTIHAGGIPCFMQFYHRGRMGRHLSHHRQAHRRFAGDVPVGLRRARGRAAGADEPRRHRVVRGALRRLAGRIADCGFDGVEIHTGADHLFDTFLSRFWNRRDDQYGAQNWENRTRFVREVIAAVRKRCGDSFHIQVFINGLEFGVGDLGLSLEENKQPGPDLAGKRRRLPARALALGGHAPGLVPERHPLLPRAAHPA